MGILTMIITGWEARVTVKIICYRIREPEHLAKKIHKGAVNVE